MRLFPSHTTGRTQRIRRFPLMWQPWERPTAKARAGSNAVDACGSSNRTDQMRSFPLWPGHGRSFTVEPTFAAAPHPSSRCRLLLTSTNSALHDGPTPPLLRPLLTSAAPSRRVATSVAKVRLGRLALAERQISQVKLLSFPSGLAGFTLPCLPSEYRASASIAALPTWPALYPVSVRRVRVLASAPFRFRLATDTLA